MKTNKPFLLLILLSLCPLFSFAQLFGADYIGRDEEMIRSFINSGRKYEFKDRIVIPGYTNSVLKYKSLLSEEPLYFMIAVNEQTGKSAFVSFEMPDLYLPEVIEILERDCIRTKTPGIWTDGAYFYELFDYSDNQYFTLRTMPLDYPSDESISLR